MTLPPDDEYGELLRRALRAEADAVVPSPDALDIIRARIAKRGLRQLLWWRVGASVAGALLVTGTVVMLVPDLRVQVIETTGIARSPTDGGRQDTSSITRPPATPPQAALPPTVAGTRHHTPTPARTTAPSPRPSPSATDPCASAGIAAFATPGAASATPGVIEPQPTVTPPCPLDEVTPPREQPTITPSFSPSPVLPSVSMKPTRRPTQRPSRTATPTPTETVTTQAAEEPSSSSS